MDKSQRRIRTILLYFLTAAFSVAWPLWNWKLWKTDLSIPFSYGQDALFYGVMIKGMIENGWYWQNPSVGLPYGLDFLDFPRTDHLHLVLLKILSLLFPHYGATMNLFFLLGFPLTALISLLVLRHFKVSPLPAVLGSLLYAFLPYHFFRNVQHIFLSAYYLIPLVVMVALWVVVGRSAEPASKNEGGRMANFRAIPNFRAAIVICLLVSSAGIYYAYFAAFFLIIAGVLAAVQRRAFAPAIAAGMLAAVICLGTILNLSPSLYYRHVHGRNPEVINRTYFQAETYGLKISQLLLPIRWHRVPPLAELREGYSRNASLTNENDCASLGFIGGMGFLLLIGGVFSHRLRVWDEKIGPLSRLNLAGLLLGTIGGFSTLVGIFFPHIRGYNRISVYLAFFSLFATSLAMDKILKNSVRPVRKIFLSFFLAAVCALGIWEQSPSSAFLQRIVNEDLYKERADFVEKVESLMPPRAMIYQLPYVPFPENPPVQKMQDYDHFGGGYLFSKELRWSYGVMRNRPGDSWQRSLTSLPPSEFLEKIALAGFQGLWVDRYGYEDGGRNLEKGIREILGTNFLETPRRRYVFYPLVPYRQGLRAKSSEEEWARKKERAIGPSISWLGGFSHPEGTPENDWRWCSREGILSLRNHSSRPRKIEIVMTLATGFPEDAEMNLSGGFISEKMSVNSRGTLFRKKILLPPGEHRIHFRCQARRVVAPGDLRTLVFRVNNFRLQEGADINRAAGG